MEKSPSINETSVPYITPGKLGMVETTNAYGRYAAYQENKRNKTGYLSMSSNQRNTNLNSRSTTLN
jgi:hypothetical protein